MKRYVQVGVIAALALVFGAAGLFKLADPSSFAEQFTNLGLPNWWIWVTGIVELLGSALISLPNQTRRRFGAAILASTMAVATGLHLIHDPVALAVPASALMLLAGYIAIIPRIQSAKRTLVDA